ncbi:unnamed protein product [Durusdinium trenchii]|uniref:Beta-galactosidase n=1 Tax=Durusdinium trenchii TaxID=1381693 RepID=A0ABP0JT31_9DINO
MTVPPCTWIFAEDPVQNDEFQGHWGNPLSAYANDRNAMPNGFRHHLMIRRLALRVDGKSGESGESRVPWPPSRVRVALRQERRREEWVQ